MAVPRWDSKNPEPNRTESPPRPQSSLRTLRPPARPGVWIRPPVSRWPRLGGECSGFTRRSAQRLPPAVRGALAGWVVGQAASRGFPDARGKKQWLLW
jgi:hypothetical protein